VEHAQLAFENASKPTFFLHVTKIKILQVTGLRMLMIPFAWTSVDSTRVSGRIAFLKKRTNKQTKKKEIHTDSRYKNSNKAATFLPAAKKVL